MSEQTPAVAAPSAVPVMEVDRGPLVNMTSEQRSEYRRTGTLPEAPKPEPPTNEDPAPSPTEETPSSETETKPEGDAQTEAAKKPQENRRKPDAEHRIKQLTDELKRVKEQLEAKATPTTEPAKPAEQPKVETQQQFTRPKPTSEDKDKDGTPKYSTYEDFVEDLADWKAEQRLAEQQREQQQVAQRQSINAKISEAKQRYGEKFDEVVKPTTTAVYEAVKGTVVEAMLNDSELLPDLLFTIGSDPTELSSFTQMAKTSPGKALRYIALTESLIREELTGKTEAKPEPPVKPQTQAPKPPAEVGGRAATPADALESAAKAGDFRAYKAEANRRALARLKG